MDWVFVSPHAEGELARFNLFENYADDYQLVMGVSVADGFPADVLVRMNPDVKDRLALGDSLMSPNNSLLVNDRVRELFAAQGVTNVEWLPLKVLNHKGKPVKDKYFVANILTLVDCIDTKKSVVKWNDIDPELIAAATKLVVDPSKLPTDVKIFRPVHLDFEILIHRSLAQAIEAKKLTGFQFREVDAYRY
jgi:hypothetical protein